MTSPHAPFSLEDFAWRASRRLSFDLPPDVFTAAAAGLGDHSLDPAFAPAFAPALAPGLDPALATPELLQPELHQPKPPQPKPAAVLVAAIEGPQGAGLLFIQRAAGLRAHAGQIAFPGGRMDDQETDPVATALREAQEEIGLPPEAVRPLGLLDAYQTGTGYRIVPVVAVVERPFEERLCAIEVAESFEAPLSFLMSPGNHALVERERGGRLRRFYAMPYGERHIWGATAGMLRNLYERLYL